VRAAKPNDTNLVPTPCAARAVTVLGIDIEAQQSSQKPVSHKFRATTNLIPAIRRGPEFAGRNEIPIRIKD
jgi:hypothetical protein